MNKYSSMNKLFNIRQQYLNLDKSLWSDSSCIIFDFRKSLQRGQFVLYIFQNETTVRR